MSAVRFVVSGKVQGVWFRASTRDEAIKLGLDACLATNLPDGCVEVVAKGDVVSLDALQAWLHQGPPLARVDTVVREDIDVSTVQAGFNIA